MSLLTSQFIQLRIVPLGALLGVLLCPLAARADQQLPDLISTVPVGLNLGGTWGSSRGGILGGEVSVAQMRHGLWFGAYADALRDFGRKTSLASVGGEVGVAFFGVDAGYVRDFGAGASGYRVRGTASWWSVPGESSRRAPLQFTIHGGGGVIGQGEDARSFYEAGLLLKFALLWNGNDSGGWRLLSPF